MRYYMHQGPAAFRFELAGELDVNDAIRLEQDWRTALSIVGQRRLIIDLSFVTEIDQAVRSLFKKWYTAGAEFAAKSGPSRELVESITGSAFTQDRPHPPTYQSWLSLKLTSVILPFIWLLTVLAPAAARASDNGASLALDRFLSRSSHETGDIAVEIDASLPELGKQGRFQAIEHRGPTGAPEFGMVRSEGDSMVKHQVIARYLAVEQQAHARPASSFAISLENYRFRYMASIEGGGDQFYVFAIKPRHRREGLMEGQIWIEAATGAMVHEEGRLAKRPSVFLREVEIVRDAGPRVDLPYVRVTHVVIETRLFGHAELTIRERPAIQISDAEILP